MSDKARQEKSKFYEEAFQAILQYVGQIDILQHSGVERSKYYRGHLSGVRRQIDATIHLHNGQRILAECKQREKPNLKLDIGDVEAFDAKCRLDIGQHVEAPIMIITTGGFSQSAINYARERNIALAILNYGATPDDHTLEFMGHPLIFQLSRNVRTAIKQKHPI